ncbi:MAG: hypothetical protein ACOYWZ_08595, partial [Bacillota bacterium]
MFKKRISIFTGHFGSGKTEVAVNFALKLSEQCPKTAIVDFDIVNPYFRTTDAKSVLEARNIWVVTPLYANTNVDVPALPAEINTLFEKKEYSVIFDVGGDDLGARVLSRYRDEILDDDYEMYFVINTKRPMTDTLEKIEQMIYEIEGSSRLKVTKLVNNTNILSSTTAKDVLEGHEMIKNISDKLCIPIAFVSGFHDLIGEVERDIESDVLYLNKLI